MSVGRESSESKRRCNVRSRTVNCYHLRHTITVTLLGNLNQLETREDTDPKDAVETTVLRYNYGFDKPLFSPTTPKTTTMNAQ